jgi:hypothetical protein
MTEARQDYTPVVLYQARPPFPFFEDVRNFEGYRVRAALLCRDENGRLHLDKEDVHMRMVRGLREKLGPQLVEPDYRQSLEAAMWHCLRIRGAAGPSPENLVDPLAPSCARLFGPDEVGVDMCEPPSAKIMFCGQ